MRLFPIALVTATLATLAACGADAPVAGTSGSVSDSGDRTVTTSSTGEGSTATTSQSSSGRPSSAEVDMCALMPVGDVQQNSPFSIALATAKRNVVPGACVYASAAGARESVGIQLIVTDFGSPSAAMTVFRNHQQDEIDHSIAPQSISGVGDVANGYPGGDEVGVQAVIGSRIVDANFKGQYPDITASQKIAAGTRLLKLLISRLP
jgi:hypothetical protein